MIEILNKCQIKEENDLKSKNDIVKNDEKGEKKNKFNFISKDKMMKCERAAMGLTNNCAICQNLNRVIFEKCQNKWS